MLQPHSLFWHYLWVAPSILLLILAGLMWRLGHHKRFPLFFAFAIVSAVGELTLYVCDLAPFVPPIAWWYVFWANLLLLGLLKFGLVGEIFAGGFDSYPSVAKLGRVLIRGAGACLLFAAALAAAWAPKDSIFGIVTGAHLLEQTTGMVEAGLLVVIFLLCSYFHLSLSRQLFGIALGLGVEACVDLAIWATTANAGLPQEKRVLLDFAEMSIHHVSVLIWFYYLLVPGKGPKPPGGSSTDPPPPATHQQDLEALNHELERLVHQ